MQAISLEIRPLAVLYTPHITYYLDCYNRKGRKCRRHEHTAPGVQEQSLRSQPYTASFYWGGGVISWDITIIQLKYLVN